MTVIWRVSKSTSGMALPTSWALNTTWYGWARTSAHSGDHENTPLPAPTEANDAGCATSLKAPPTADSVTPSPSGSEANTLKVSVSPASTQVSPMAAISGGWLAHNWTSIWRSRVTSPTLRRVPPTSLHSSMRMATLYSPAIWGVFHVTSPVSSSMVNTSGAALTSSG